MLDTQILEWDVFKISFLSLTDFIRKYIFIFSALHINIRIM